MLEFWRDVGFGRPWRGRTCGQRNHQAGIALDTALFQEEAPISASWVAALGRRSLRAKLPRLIHQICMNGLGIIGGEHIVPAAHALSLINALEHDLVEQLMGRRRELAQIRQQCPAECVASAAIPVVENFAAVNRRGVAFPGGEVLLRRINHQRRLGRLPSVQSEGDDAALIAVLESGAFRREG